MALAKTLFWLALVVWLGEIVFFSFVVAPTVFGTFPKDVAGQVVGAIFPRYYAVGAAAGAIALIAAVVLRGGTSATRSWSLIAVMLVVMLVATLYAGRVIEPRARALRPQLHAEPVDVAGRAEFDRLHARAVQLNGVVLLLGIVTVSIAAATLQLPRR
jgi:p-aminobenzoyl-glutamate transporter AbgT